MDSHADGHTDTPRLTKIEARILGALAEKAVTTPDVYPLTVNNLVMACNQKTAREPVMQLDPGEVGHALRQMEVRGLVRSHYSARSERYQHRMEQVFDLTPAQACLLSLLMLRGPQTVHELLTRSERLHRFADIDEVRHALERLGERRPALVRKLERGTGQREDRYAHLLCGEPVVEAHGDWRSTDNAHDNTHDRTDPTASASLLARIEALEARVATLEAADASRASHREEEGTR